LSLEVFTQRNFVAEIELYSKYEEIVFESPFGDLEVTYAFHLELVGKTVVDFLFVVIERFHCLFS